jgi:APA family basic amino acid/polyamine antiporter
MPPFPDAHQSPSVRSLTRSIGLPGATLLGLGSILGTGAFVSIGLAAGVAGGWVILATAIAALLATANALSSAQLAAAHSVSGGTYEYAHRVLNPRVGPMLGFASGWMFLAAKSASAATAALGCSAYLLGILGIDLSRWTVPVALGAITCLTCLVLAGLRRSSIMNAIIVAVTMVTLLTFVAMAMVNGTQRSSPTSDASAAFQFSAPNLLEASAIMFVAFTGYGRIATMGEEVREPTRTIPRAIFATLVISAALYIAVSISAVSVLGPDRLASAVVETGAPLEAAARAMQQPLLAGLVAIAAVTAMLGVLLNLILGLSRVGLAMGRRGDLPSSFARIDAAGKAPAVATIGVGVLIAVIASLGSVEFAWSFSAFAVLIYYAITNLCALRLPAGHQRYPRWIAWSGLAACVGLGWWVEPAALRAGLITLGAGFVVRFIIRKLGKPSPSSSTHGQQSQ